MFDVEHEGKTYAVRFARFDDGGHRIIKNAPEHRGEPGLLCRVTTCVIVNTDVARGCDAHVAKGEAVRSDLDNPNNNTGRKVALRRALATSGFDRPTRFKFWEAYSQERPGKKM